MVNYANGKIYKIVNNIDDEIYVGSTCNPLYKRKGGHKSNGINKYSQQFNYKHWNRIGWDNIDIVLIENYPCASKDELHRRERYWIENLKPSLNKRVPTRTMNEYYYDNRYTKLEYAKEQRKINTEYNKEYHKIYQTENKEKLQNDRQEYKTIYIMCDCGTRIKKATQRRHERSKLHMRWQNIYDFIYS